MKFKFTTNEATKFNKHGVDLTLYNEGIEPANIVHVSVKEGHFEEFMDAGGYYSYYIIEGSGVFFLDGKEVKAEATDLIVVPPKTPIHYFGKMEMILVVSPAYREERQVHIRDINREDSPLKEEK